MTGEPYEARWSESARRAVAERVPEGIALAAVELITGPLRENPRRLGKPLGDELVGIYSARLARDWRVLYEIDEVERVVIVLDIRHRSIAYRAR
ncbi:mRNA-degrading endonuclease RelE of RelBE toxin-antitoxin system [Haloactinopolyspora alba]|uniref:mRNA-degrading endonuclease RelE of RelBE toxin-antitoxin system n=1 Tax=Haloactinopolyspora alba TaxID=648780 RepID=A0A2P8E5L3_9ACTN|nr:type II toxin-antitoxin system RelE/ParE family toxin [Haloactinopolyspora alba]PSL04766.1 mRNA-degrading endonuclease RelE of RelBE toxin-antitoxin system [Haloactinopolyspora alba]